MTIPPHPQRLTPPLPPSVQPRPSFPLIAALAPILSSLVLYALTSSPYTLALAALGPVVAVASFLDGARVRRRTARQEGERYRRETAVYSTAVANARAAELAAARLSSPAPLDILEKRVSIDARWRRTAGDLEVVLGRGRAAPILGGSDGDRPPLDSPLSAALSAGIGIVGPAVLARAVVRGLLIQCAELVPPDALAVELPNDSGWDCLRPLPHTRSAAAPIRLVVSEGGRSEPAESDAVIALADSAADLPRRCRCIVQVGGPGPTLVIGRVGAGAAEALSVDYVSSEQARRYSAALGESADDPRALPTTVLLADLDALVRRGGGSGLPAVLGWTSGGPLEIDLVHDGPHAIVGGTTGSGKSELLVAWIVALAARHAPSTVTFLLADFKGGAGFGALERLPHVTGVITDLDPDAAARAFASIAAELRRREVILAEHGVPDIARLDAGVLARLVIVVDECAVVLERSPELHRTFADIAARGRSLGIHLVLCTQRPVGVVRDAVAANCGLRIALRVHDAADSRSLIGSDAAARLPHGAAGRCVVAIGGRRQTMQAALARPEDVASASAPGDGDVVVHRPWRDPLPPRIPLPSVRQVGRIVLGVVDRPAEQRHDVVALQRRSLLVLGAGGSGRTTVLRTVAAQLDSAPLVGPLDAEEAWDAVTAAGGPVGPLLLDDLDLLLRRCSDEERRRLLDALQTALRADGDPIIVSARRVTDGLAALRDAFDDVLLLRAANRQEHQMLALHGESYRGDLPPGGGWWRGERLQVFATEAVPGSSARGPVEVVTVGREGLAVLTDRPGRARDALRSAGSPAMTVAEAAAADRLPPGSAVVGSVLEWTSARVLLSRLRSVGGTAIDVPPSEARILLGPLAPPPLCVGDRVLLEKDGRLRRARWPSTGAAQQEESAV